MENILADQSWLFFAIALSISIAGFSIFISIYSTYSQNIRNAEVNMVAYTRQTDILEKKKASVEEIENSRKIAGEWAKASIDFRENAAKRAFTAFWFFLSLLASLVMLIMLLLPSGRSLWCWLAPLLVSVILILCGVLSSIFRFPIPPSLSKFAHKITGINPIVAVSDTAKKEIEGHNWLKTPYYEDYPTTWLKKFHKQYAPSNQDDL